MLRLRFTNRTGRLHRPRARTRGQALVEFALMGLVLAMLLAAAVDFGRAYYTALIVENMAGEGAAYGAKWPMNDLASPGCAGGGVVANKNIQDRARRVAADRGLVIRQPTQADVEISPPNCYVRCPGTGPDSTLKVTVTYRMNDLFLPSLLGMQSVTIKKSATQRVETAAHRPSCPNP